MRAITLSMTVFMLAGCVSNSDTSKFVLSEPNDSVIVETTSQNHKVRIDEDHYLYYNDEQQFYVHEDQLVVVESDSPGEPRFTVLDKKGRSYGFDISF